MIAKKFKIVKKDSLFYNRWKYSLGADLFLSGCLRSGNLDYDSVCTSLNLRHQWDLQWKLRQSPWGIEHSSIKHDYTAEDDANLYRFATLLERFSNQFKLVVGRNSFYLYTDDLTLIDQTAKLTGVQNVLVQEAVVDRPKNTIKLRSSPYQHRSYLRWKPIDNTEKSRLNSFFVTQGASVRLSPGFQGMFVDDHYKWTQDHFFFDYSDPGVVVMLNLVVPGLVRKTVSILVG